MVFDGSEGSAQSVEAAQDLEPFLPEEVWPAFMYTEDEADILLSTGADIEKYAGEMLDKFIVGETPISEWDEYVDTLYKMGLEEYMEIQQQAYERYIGN